MPTWARLVVVACVAMAFVPCALCSLGVLLALRNPGAIEAAPTVEASKAAFEAWCEATPAPESCAELSVIVAADEEYRSRANWEDDARALLEAGSEVLRRECGVRLRIVDLVPWSTPDDAASLKDLYQFAHGLLCDRTDLVVALTGQRHCKGMPSPEEYDRGFAPYFERVALMRPNHPGEGWPYDRETIAHEIGHTLGAWHPADDGSFMRVNKSGAEVYTLDATAHLVIERTLALPLRDGLDVVDEDMERFITAQMKRQIRRGSAWEVEHPVCYSLCHRGTARLNQGWEAQDVAADAQRARRLARELGGQLSEESVTFLRVVEKARSRVGGQQEREPAKHGEHVVK